MRYKYAISLSSPPSSQFSFDACMGKFVVAGLLLLTSLLPSLACSTCPTSKKKSPSLPPKPKPCPPPPSPPKPKPCPPPHCHQNQSHAHHRHPHQSQSHAHLHLRCRHPHLCNMAEPPLPLNTRLTLIGFILTVLCAVIFVVRLILLAWSICLRRQSRWRWLERVLPEASLADVVDLEL